MDSKDKSFIDILSGCLGSVVLVVVALVFSVIFNGYTLSVLWGWFVSTTFGLPPISIAQAIGLSMIVGMFNQRLAREKNETEREGLNLIVFAVIKDFVMCLFILGIGWFIYGFIPH